MNRYSFKEQMLLYLIIHSNLPLVVVLVSDTNIEGEDESPAFILLSIKPQIKKESYYRVITFPQVL